MAASLPVIVCSVIIEDNILTRVCVYMMIQHLADDRIGKCFFGFVSCVKVIHGLLRLIVCKLYLSRASGSTTPSKQDTDKGEHGDTGHGDYDALHW